MTNIPTRLREHVEKRGGPSQVNGVWQLMLDAAAELEEAVADLAAARAMLQNSAIVRGCITGGKIAPPTLRCMDCLMMETPEQRRRRTAERLLNNPAIMALMRRKPAEA